jgi:DNA-binding transcriptional MerR regulator
MDRRGYSIGDLAAQTDTKVPTIRYYEEIKLLPAPPRTEGGQRRYSREHLDRLKFIRHSRELGFAVEEIRELLRLSAHPDSPCDAVDDIATKHLSEVDRKIKRLQSLRKELKRMIGECGKGPLRHCRIIETLSDHQLCAADHAASSARSA